MPWSGSSFTRSNGTFTGANVWQNDAGSGQNIVDTRHDSHDQDLASGINATLNKNGQNTPTANLPMGGYKHTNVANATARSQYVAAGQIQDNDLIFAGTSSGSANVYEISLSPGPTSYADGMGVLFISHQSNTASCTLNIGSVAAKSLVSKAGADLGGYEIFGGQLVKATYVASDDKFYIDFIKTDISNNNNISGVLPSSHGGTDSEFFSVAGPTATRTITFPDANETVMTLGQTQTITGSKTFSGTITAQSTLTAQALVATTSAIDCQIGQIKFPASQNASSDANTLDDYEEGTWTPSLTFGGGSTGLTYTTRFGSYTKIGRLVTVTAQILLSSKGSSTGQARLGGIPFPFNAAASYGTGIPAIHFASMATTGIASVGAVGYNGYSTLDIVASSGATSGTVALNDGNFTNNTLLVFSGTYEA